MKNEKKNNKLKVKVNMHHKFNKFINFIKKNYISFFKETPIIFLFIVSCLLNTIIFRLITVNNIFYYKPILMDLGILFIISSFAALFKTERSKFRYLLCWSFFTSILCIVQAVYYSYYSSFGSVSMLATSAFISDVSDAVVEVAINADHFIFLWQPIFLIFMYNILKRKKYLEKIRLNKKFTRKFSFLNLIITGIIVAFVCLATMTKTEWSRFTKMWNRESVVSSFGIYTYQFNDIFQSIQPKINNLFGHDKALKYVMDYYDENPSVVSNNDYTGIFEGKNVIVIHAESLQRIALESSFNGVEVAPNFKRLADEGIYFNNYYSQVGVGTSSDAEFTFSSSLMPSSSGTVFVNYFDREYSTIQKLFKEKGYYVFSMHANTGDFWNRETMHKNMGYDKFYSKSSFNIDETIGLGLSDKSFFKQVVPKIKKINENNGLFYGTLITLTNHTPFSDLDLMDEFPTTKKFEVDGNLVDCDYINGTTLGNYFRSVHYADQAIGQFIEDMDANGLLDNTVIVIYGDHDARISKKNYNLMYNYDPVNNSVLKSNDDGYIQYNDYNYQLDKSVPFIIWTKDGKYNKTVSTPMGMIDAMPTLGNMFNIHNDFQLGHDILNINNGENTVVFTDGSYLTDKIYYDGQNGEVYLYNGDSVSEDYILKNTKYADELMSVSNNIITYNLIKEIKEKKSNQKESN